MAVGAGRGSAVEGRAARRAAAQRSRVKGELALCLCDLRLARCHAAGHVGCSRRFAKSRLGEKLASAFAAQLAGVYAQLTKDICKALWSALAVASCA